MWRPQLKDLLTDDIADAMERVDRAAGKILDRTKEYDVILVDAESKERDELLRASLSLLNKIRRNANTATDRVALTNCECHQKSGSHELCCGHADGRSPDCPIHGDGSA